MSRAGRFEWERAFRAAEDVPATVRLVGYCAATWANRDGGGVRPGAARLRAGTGLGRTAVFDALRWLVQYGWLVPQDDGTTAPGRTREYVLAVAGQQPLNGAASAAPFVVGEWDDELDGAAQPTPFREERCRSGGLTVPPGRTNGAAWAAPTTTETTTETTGPPCGPSPAGDDDDATARRRAPWDENPCCDNGWRETTDGDPVPCATHKPHLAYLTDRK